MKATTHFQPGAAPTSNVRASDLFEPHFANMAGYCGAAANQWCCDASYSGFQNGILGQWSGKFVPTECTDTITIDYTLQSDQRTWVHTVSKNGAVISTLQTWRLRHRHRMQRQLRRLRLDTDLHEHHRGTVVLSKADPLFSSTLGVGAGVQASQPMTADSGKT
ncbi:hypothetical protein B0H14DRAFT_3463331 [Mycena olivaceomarginata]|nr:hypothetical protein B0H14DRAFT_3463331 [Mycena olivaceomarginata]